MDTLYVVDASGYLYRSYHAIQHLTNAKGESTNALYGFIRSLLKLVKDFHPECLVAVFDGPRSIEKRMQIYSQYKAQRTAMPEDLRYQIQWAQDFCRLYGIPHLVLPQVEADDVMGSLAVWAEQQGSTVFLCTSDKDLCQFVNDHVFLLNTHKDNLIVDRKKVEELFGVPPEKIVDYLAITGDASDNIPGISGFGPKTAASLLQEFASLEEILQNPEKIGGKKKQETLIQEADIARISKQLATIDTDVPIPKEQSFYKLQPPQSPQEVQAFYSSMDFRSLLKEFAEGREEETKEECCYRLVDNAESLQELVAELSSHSEICFDTEATHFRPMEAELVGIGFSVKEGAAWYVPVNGALGKEQVVQALKPLFENPAIGFYGHNVKYDWHVLKNTGIEVKNICFDTIIASYLLNSHHRQHSLDSLALAHFDKRKIPITALIGKGKSAISMRDVPLDNVCEYCCEDADYTLRLKKLFSQELEQRGLHKLFFNLELPLVKVLAAMERRGIFVDVPCLESMGKKINHEIAALEQEIQALAGEPFNINSPKQLGAILFEKMGIKPPKKIATGFSTNAEVLEFLQQEHLIAKKVLEFRTIEKLRSTYIEALPKEVNPNTGRIHPSFIQFVAATGRLSCQDPNLQNIPIRNPIGKEIRTAFRPQKEGWSYLSADYSQIELRLLAHFSEDPNLIKAFENNEDIHAFTAALILNIPLSQVNKEQRYQAKAVNFGIIYGQQAFGLAKELGISREEAAAFIRKYFDRYPKIHDFLEMSKEKARQTGKATTLLGRERTIAEIDSKNPQIRAQAERLAVNTPLQGTSADLIKVAMLAIDKKIADKQKLSAMILQIHDALIFEVPDAEIESISRLVKHEMETVYPLKVPLVVDINIGKNWKEC